MSVRYLRMSPRISAEAASAARSTRSASSWSVTLPLPISSSLPVRGHARWYSAQCPHPQPVGRRHRSALRDWVDAGYFWSWLPSVSTRCEQWGLRLVVSGSGKWLIRRAGYRGQAGHAGCQSRPRVPSRARLPCPVVEDHLVVDDVGQAAFEGAHGFPGCFAGGDFAVVVGAAFGGVAELDDGHDVQRAVDLAVACPR